MRQVFVAGNRITYYDTGYEYSLFEWLLSLWRDSGNVWEYQRCQQSV